MPRNRHHRVVNAQPHPRTLRRDSGYAPDAESSFPYASSSAYRIVSNASVRSRVTVALALRFVAILAAVSWGVGQPT